MVINFREANLESDSDNEAIVSLLNEFMNNRSCTAGNERINNSIIDGLKKIGTAKIYLCEDSNKIFGIAVCFVGFSTYKQKELLNIHDLFIQAEYQGKGIGKSFLNYIERECKRNNFCRVTLEVYGDNANAIKLYRNSGYIGNDNTEDNCLIYAMKKEIS